MTQLTAGTPFAAWLKAESPLQVIQSSSLWAVWRREIHSGLDRLVRSRGAHKHA